MLLATDIQEALVLPCTLDPEMWFSSDKAERQKAASLCRTECPRVLKCLHEALATEKALGHTMHGIHGGLTEAQRRKTTLKHIA